MVSGIEEFHCTLIISCLRFTTSHESMKPILQQWIQSPHDSRPLSNTFDCISIYVPEFLITFETWIKLGQQWLVCVPLGIPN